MLLSEIQLFMLIRLTLLYERWADLQVVAFIIPQAHTNFTTFFAG